MEVDSARDIDCPDGAREECPKCGSDDISAKEYDGDYHELWCVVECGSCWFEWVEVYKFSHCEPK